MIISEYVDKCYGFTSAEKGLIFEVACKSTILHHLPTHSEIHNNVLTDNSSDIDLLLINYGLQIECKNFGDTSFLKIDKTVIARSQDFKHTSTSSLNALNPGLNLNYKTKKKCTRMALLMAQENGLSQSKINELQSHHVKVYILDTQFLPIDATIPFKIYQEYTGIEYQGSLYHLFQEILTLTEIDNDLAYSILKDIFPSHLFDQFEKLILTLINDLTLYCISNYYLRYYPLIGIQSIISSLITYCLLLILQFFRSGLDPPLLYTSTFFDYPSLPNKKSKKEGVKRMCKRQNRVIAALRKKLNEFIGEYETPVPHQNKTCLEMAIEYFNGGESA